MIFKLHDTTNFLRSNMSINIFFSNFLKVYYQQYQVYDCQCLHQKNIKRKYYSDSINCCNFCIPEKLREIMH